MGTFNEFEGFGGDDVITGNGNTRLTFNQATSGVTVDFVTGIASGDASVGEDHFTGVNSVTGSHFGDTLFGSDNPPGPAEGFVGMAGATTSSMAAAALISVAGPRRRLCGDRDARVGIDVQIASAWSPATTQWAPTRCARWSWCQRHESLRISMTPPV